MNKKYNTNNNIVFNCQYHVIWCTKYRTKVLTHEVETRLKQILSTVADDTKCEIIEMETDKDHIHLLISVDPQFGIMKFIKRAKGKTSKILREEFPSVKSRIPTLWTNSAFVSTVGNISLEKVKKYIENQQLSQRDKEKNKWVEYLKDVN